MKNYDVIIVGAGPGGIFSAYELSNNDSVLYSVNCVSLPSNFCIEFGTISRTS